MMVTTSSTKDCQKAGVEERRGGAGWWTWRERCQVLEFGVWKRERSDSRNPAKAKCKGHVMWHETDFG